jgi:hypothetical protein
MCRIARGLDRASARVRRREGLATGEEIEKRRRLWKRDLEGLGVRHNDVVAGNGGPLST